MQTTLEKLKEIKENYPALTFDNNGYEYISLEVRESHKEVIQEIERLLRDFFVGEDIVKFNNFKPREDGTFSVRCQTVWDRNIGFIGVTYFHESAFVEDKSNDSGETENK